MANPIVTITMENGDVMKQYMLYIENHKCNESRIISGDRSDHC